MRVTAEKLGSLLRQNLASCYCLHGDDPFLCELASQTIRDKAVAQQLTHVKFSLHHKKDWQSLRSYCEAGSLFSAGYLIEASLATVPNKTTSEQLMPVVSQRHTPHCLLLRMGKCDRKTLNSRWLAALDKQGVIVHVANIPENKLGDWIQKQAQQQDCTIETEASDYLAQLCASNPQHAYQEIRKLKLSYPNETISVDQIKMCCSDQSRYSLFTLADACLSQDKSLLINTLRYLRQIGTEPVLVLWALIKSIRELAKIAEAVASGTTVSAAMQAEGVWQARQSCVNQAITQRPSHHWQKCLQFAQHVDMACKGVGTLPAWEGLTELCALLAGHTLPMTELLDCYAQ